MATVEFILALEERMELVPLRKGWWVAFGAPRQPPRPSVGPSPLEETETAGADAPESPMVPEVSERLSREPHHRHGGNVPLPEPRPKRREPQPPTPRPMPNPAPAPAPNPDPPGSPEIPGAARARRR